MLKYRCIIINYNNIYAIKAVRYYIITQLQNTIGFSVLQPSYYNVCWYHDIDKNV